MNKSRKMIKIYKKIITPKNILIFNMTIKIETNSV